MGEGLLEVLHNDALLGICRCLPARALLDTGASCSELQRRSRDCTELWRALCEFLLGATALQLHEAAWSAGAADAGSAQFYRRLFRATWSCDEFCYDHKMRNLLLGSIGQGGPSGPAGEEAARYLLCTSGHTAEALGPFVLQLGGMRSAAEEAAEPVHVTVIDLARGRVLRPALARDSRRPAQRMRHASCTVAAPFLGPAALPGAVLVIVGGESWGPAGQPRAGVRSLLLLQVTAADGSEVRWSEVPATGEAPAVPVVQCCERTSSGKHAGNNTARPPPTQGVRRIYNHACASFDGGRRVCLFGGDIPATDPEFARIRRRESARFVYVLDVPLQHWSVVETGGQVPTWRSFHTAVAHTSLLDGREYFVTFGGTHEHCEPLSGGSLASMVGYQLDLQSFNWAGVRFANAPQPLPPGAFETGPPAAGCVVGGARPTARGAQLLQRLVVFRLLDAASSADAEAMPEPILGGERSASEERYNINFFAVGDTCPWAARKLIPLRCHRKGINFPAALGQMSPTAKKFILYRSSPVTTRGGSEKEKALSGGGGASRKPSAPPGRFFCVFGGDLESF
ncbi:unnamed protein product [Prorocentrum cordatum]|uniref:Uncharacterized protein n=1 Tax=Prorocentrum cordatum TaxID=2364126 RepID=A0ABN9XFW6_9DINO|nr:unnamed protein product [Polarella glacialis]